MDSTQPERIAFLGGYLPRLCGIATFTHDSNGFNARDCAHADFDQQPVEAQAMVSACLDAHRATQEPVWSWEAKRAFEWFLGRNDLALPVYDPSSGGCGDGLHEDRISENQGAESTLAFHLALAEMNESDFVVGTGKAAR